MCRIVNRAFSLAVTLSSGLWTVSAAAAQPDKVPASKPIQLGALSITVQPAKKVFGPKEALKFHVTFTNDGKKSVKLGVGEYLGSQTVGQYVPHIRDLKTKMVWKVGRDPNVPLPGVPARLFLKTLEPEESLTTRYLLPGVGRRFWQGKNEKAPAQASSHLPPGQYEITITIQRGKQQVQTKPVGFQVSK